MKIRPTYRGDENGPYLYWTRQDIRTNKEYLWMVRAVVETTGAFSIMDKGINGSGTVIGQNWAKDLQGLFFQCDGLLRGFTNLLSRPTRTCALLNCMASYTQVFLSRHFAGKTGQMGGTCP